MKRLPLYPEGRERQALETEPARAVTGDCRRCPLHGGATTVCIPAEGEPGGILIVGTLPTRSEDVKGRPFIGSTGVALRRAVEKIVPDAPVVFDYAVRCTKGKQALPSQAVPACRGYLAKTVEEARPSRIVTLGRTPWQSVTGRTLLPERVRRATTWVERDGHQVPVFAAPDVYRAARNAALRRWFREDLEWALTADPVAPPPGDAYFRQVETVEDAEAAAAELRALGVPIAYDLETAGLRYSEYFEIVCASFYPASPETLAVDNEFEGFVVERRQWQKAAIREPFLALLEDRGVAVGGWNVKYDHGSIVAAHGRTVRRGERDGRLMHKLTWATSSGKLEDVAETVAMGGHKHEFEEQLETAVKAVSRARTRTKKGPLLPGIEDPAIEAATRHPEAGAKAFAFALVDPEIRARYCARDTLSTARLLVRTEDNLNELPQVRRIWDQVVSKATEVVTQIEAWGIRADRRAIRRAEMFLEKRVADVEARLNAYGERNWASNDQVAEFLFEQLHLPIQERSEKTGKPSTDGATLKALSGKHAVVDDLIEYRAVTKLYNAYGKPMMSYVREDGRIHPSLLLDGTETGRMSCQDPGLHQTPRADTVEGKLIKDCFAAAHGYTLLQLDYSQLEYRVAALLSGDPVMKQMFEAGDDFHQATAELIAPTFWGIRPDQVTKKHRSIAKTFNFGLLYGMTDGGLAARMGCSRAEAARLRQAIMGAWKVLAKWLKAKLKETRETGFAYTEWEGQYARRRPLPDIHANERGFKINAENAAINTPVQGSASEYCLASLCEIVPWLIEDAVPAKVVLTVHDSIIFEVREDALEEVALGAADIMTQWDSRGVPIKVDAEVGYSWGSLKKYDLAALTA